jgi:hypothetical protein
MSKIISSVSAPDLSIVNVVMWAAAARHAAWRGGALAAVNPSMK